MTLFLLYCGIAFGNTVLDNDGWRRQEQSGTVAWFKGEEAMVMIVPARPAEGSARTAFGKALQSYMGGNVVAGGEVRDAENGAVTADYEVREANGSRTFRSAIAWIRNGQLEGLLYATNDANSFQRHRATAQAFFAAYRPAAGSASPAPSGNAAPAPAALLGEWYTGRISTIQYQDRVTGALAAPSGNNMTYKFNADGTYQQYGLMQFTYATCTNSYFMNITGRYEVHGDELRMIPIDGTFDSRTCGGAPVRKPTNKVESVNRIRLSGNELTMTDKTGASSTYRRK